MNRMMSYLFILVVFSCIACTESEVYRKDDSIRLAVSVDGVDVSTRAAQHAQLYEGTVPSPSNPLDAAVLFSTVSGEYRHAPAGPTYLPCHTTIHYTSAVPTDPAPWSGNNLKYPTSDVPVYCVGLYPKEGWTVSGDGKKAVFDGFDGFQDIMFAEQISGRWSSHFSGQTYEHLLSWLKVCVVAVDAESPVFWGKLKQISVETGSEVEIVLYDSGNGGAKVSYAGSCTPQVFDGDHQLNTSIYEVGSVLCTPALSYTFNVRTEKEEKSVEVTLMDKNSNPLTSAEQAVGKQFVVELYFHPFSIIEGDCTLQAWEYKEDNFYLK